MRLLESAWFLMRLMELSEVAQDFCKEKGLKMVQVLMTHAHWDHTLDLYMFNEAAVPVLGHKDDQFYLKAQN